jgi:hypothetical protein
VSDDSGTKRALSWFMNWIREEHGESKANYMWKRFGNIICIQLTVQREL